MFGLSTVHQGRTKEVKDARPKSIFLLTREREKKNNKFQHLLYTYIYPPLSLSLSLSTQQKIGFENMAESNLDTFVRNQMGWKSLPDICFVSDSLSLYK
jgi:hypothetical protein